MKGKDIFKSSLPEFVVMLPQVEGLTTASKVTMKGVVVGKVENMKLSQKNDRMEVQVRFSLYDPNLKIPANSVIKLVSDGIMGGKSLAIIPGDGEPAKNGSTLAGKVENDIFATVEEQFDPIQKEVTKTLISTNKLVEGLNDVLDEKTRKSLKTSILKLNNTLTEINGITHNLQLRLQKNEAKIDSAIDGTQKAIANINTLTDQVNKDLKEAELGNTVKELKTTIRRINAILDGLEEGEGSMGKLLKDDKLYTHLDNASKELEELLREMKEHPKRFVHFSLFGKKDKGYQEEHKGE